MHAATARVELYLSHFLNAVGEYIRDDDPLLRRRPQVHLHQDNVVEQHEVGHICHLHRSTTAEGDQQGLIYGYVLVHFSHCAQIEFNSLSTNKGEEGKRFL